MKLLVTGITGFLGSHLAEHWVAAGHTVAGTSRSCQPNLVPNCRMIAFSLGDEFPSAHVAGMDAVVHSAYDRTGSMELNIRGTKAVCMAAEEAGVGYQLFVGSYAARPRTSARYGRVKYDLETFFLERGHTVVRPGLVVGNGGLFARNMNAILRTPVIPLLDGGRDPIPVIAVEDFVQATDLLLQRRSIGVFNLFNRELVPMRTFVQTIGRAAGRRRLHLSIPLNLALFLVAVAEKLHLPLPVGTDSIRSIKNSIPGVYKSDLERIVPQPRSFETMVAAAVRAKLSAHGEGR